MKMAIHFSSNVLIPNPHRSIFLPIRSPALKSPPSPPHKFPAVSSEQVFGCNRLLLRTARSPKPRCSQLEEGATPRGSIQILTVPPHWLLPSRALEEAEWLRATLHKWLDEEYCPEPTNVEISKVAAASYHSSLLQKTTDMGEILVQMARDLQSISYQESFHGAFSSANAAIDLIAQRIELDLEGREGFKL